MADVSLTKIDNRTNVSLTKGATQASINSALSETKGYRDEAETFKDLANESASSASTSAASASASKTSALSSASTALSNATIATTQAGLAQGYASNAESSATDAQTAQTAAETAQGLAEDAQEAAETAQGLAETAESNAVSSATSASASATTATTQAGIATTQAGLASDSASEASASETNAASSEVNAATSASNASTSETNASNSASAAATSASNASNSESNAATSETNASTSASNAATSETNAANSANSASTSASNAATSETNANNSATAAASSASDAAGYASDAQGYATAFLNSEAYNITSTDTNNWDTAYGWGNHSTAGYLTTETDPVFTAWDKSTGISITESQISDFGTYLESVTASDIDSETATDGYVLTADGSGNANWEVAASPYGNSEVDAHLNTSTATTDQVLSWNGSDYDWVDASGSEFSYTRTIFTATASQTSFTVSYTTGLVDVYLNGLKLQRTVDYADTSGTAIVLTSGANSGDIVEVLAFELFTIADAYTKDEIDSAGYITNTSYSTTIATTDTWTNHTTYWTLSKTVSGILSTDKPFVDVDFSSATVTNIADLENTWSAIYRVATSTNTVTFYALSEPTFVEDLDIKMEVFR